MVQSGRTLCGDAGALDHAPRRALPQGSAFRGFDIFETEARREQKAMRINFGSTQMEFDAPLTVYDAAVAAGLISRAVLAAHVNGKLCALTQMLDGDADVELLTFADEDGKHVFRHTASHILAQAVKRLYPETKLTIGPAIENGFYYDFDSDVSFTPDILHNIEAEMKKIVKENEKIERFELPRAEAIAFMQEHDEPYKVQLIEELPEGEVISFYRQGEFTDLCAGVPADAVHRRLLEGRSEEQDAPARVRHGFPDQGRAERLSCRRGGRQAPGSQQDRA